MTDIGAHEPRGHRIHIKVVLVGMSGCGKTTLARTWYDGCYPKKVDPVEEPLTKDVTLDGIDYTISVYDTTGEEQYERLRPLSYPGTDIFLLVYSIGRLKSFAYLTMRFIPEIQHFVPNTEFVFVGAKLDLRTDEYALSTYLRNGMLAVRQDSGVKLAEQYHTKTFEISCLNGEGITELFEHVIRRRAPAPPKPPRNKKCTIL